MKAIRTWVLIADGARAHIVENTGPGRGLAQVEGMDFRHPLKRAHEMNSDRPGRSFESADSSRHAIEPSSDPVRMKKRNFAQDMADVLTQALNARRFDRLVIAAAPATLGDLRDLLGDGVKKVITAELDKDLTKIPHDKLLSHLESVL